MTEGESVNIDTHLAREESFFFDPITEGNSSNTSSRNEHTSAKELPVRTCVIVMIPEDGGVAFLQMCFFHPALARRVSSVGQTQVSIRVVLS